jgi:TolA-binding protein
MRYRMLLPMTLATALLLPGPPAGAHESGTAAATGERASGVTPTPRPSYAPQDPADSLWRAARAALNENEYRRAAQLFRQITTRHPRSAYAADAFYFEALALSRLNTPAELRTARQRLRDLEQRFPNAANLRDARELAVRIDGQLARQGDAEAAARVAERSQPAAAPRAPTRRAPTRPSAAGCPDDGGVRAAALNALLVMESSQALPLLREVMANRHECNAPLRRQAIFLIAQKHAADAEDVLLDAVRNDPDRQVRENAIFWLSQVPGERAVDALVQVLRGSDDRRVQERAVFALSQHRHPRAAETLRAWALRDDASLESRRQAVFWLGQQPGQSAFLRDVYARSSDTRLKESVLFAMSQSRDAGSERWLIDIALNEREPVNVRKQALFMVAQHTALPTRELIGLYDRVTDREMRRHLMFVFFQRSDSEIVDKMMDIARNDADPEVRKQAIFWLGQSKDPRVARFLLDIIGGS